ncbi:Copine-7 [Lobulomyces angularis]|nr:Copine-7 [Lobulomyces angularis]
MVMLHKKVYNPLTKSYDWDKKPQKTEVLQNTLNPVFEKMFSIDYVYSEKLELKFLVVDVHGYEYLEDSEDHDFLGSVEITLDEIVYEKKPVTLPLKYGSFQNLGVIKIAPFAKKLHDKIDLTLAFHAILEKPIFNKINTFFTIHRSNLLDKNFELLHESDVISKCFKPVFPNLELNLANVLKEADSEEDCLLKFEVFQQKLVGNAEFMGCFQTTLNELITNKGRALEFELINERKRVAKSGNKSGVVSSYKNSGIFNVSCIKYDQYTSFFDYVYNGLKLNAGFAIDLRINGKIIKKRIKVKN